MTSKACEQDYTINSSIVCLCVCSMCCVREKGKARAEGQEEHCMGVAHHCRCMVTMTRQCIRGWEPVRGWQTTHRKDPVCEVKRVADNPATEGSAVMRIVQACIQNSYAHQGNNQACMRKTNPCMVLLPPPLHGP